MSILTFMRSLIRGESKSSSFPFSGVGSLLISEIAGFSASRSEIPPLELIEVIGRILEAERRCIHESDGFTPFSGVGEVMLGVWSSPSHAAVALETGRRILAESKKVQTEIGFSLQVRVGVTTGNMTVD